MKKLKFLFLIVTISMMSCSTEEDPFESNRDRIEDIIRFNLSYFSYIDELNENISNANSWGLGSLATLLTPSKRLINEVGNSLVDTSDIKDAFRSLYSIDEEGNVSNPSEGGSQEQNVAKGIYEHYMKTKVLLDEPKLKSDTKKQRIYEVLELRTTTPFLVNFLKNASGEITHFEVELVED